MTTEEKNSNASLQRLLKVGFAEGISFLVLLGIAMPLKYCAGMPLPVRIVGMLHGVLFIWYVVSLFNAKRVYNWQAKKTTMAFIASLIPFGPFFLHKILSK